MATRQSQGTNGSLIIGLIAGVVILYLLFNLFGLAFRLLAFLAPVLFLIALFINHKVVINYFKGIWERTKVNPIFGIGQGLLTFFAFPFVSAYLLGKAVLVNKVEKLTGQTQTSREEYAEYEEVKDDDDEDFLSLDDIKKHETPKAEPQTRTDNRYDDLFE